MAIQFGTNISSFRDNRSGSIAVNFGLSVTFLLAIVGGAIDYNRWLNAKRITSAALDAAVLAGARSLQANPGNAQLATSTATTSVVSQR